MDLLKDPRGRLCWHQNVQPKSIFFVREAVLDIFNEVEAMSKLKIQDRVDIGVAVKVELDPK